MASNEVVEQTQRRLLSALGRVKYEQNISELVGFSSFFAAALVASQDGFLASKFSKKEAERARQFFTAERSSSKMEIMAQCFGAPVKLEGGEEGPRAQFSMPFEQYLALATKHELVKSPRWKLGRQALEGGIIYMSDSLLNDFFEACAQAAVADGVRNLRRATFPRQLAEVKASVLRYVPVQQVKTGKGYLYVEDLLKHPTSDGRHRLVWLVLAPYLVNVKKLEEADAIDRIRAFVAVAGETGDMRRFIEYNVRRARRNGLLPPTFSTLKSEHPDLYGLLPSEIIEAEAASRGKPPRRAS